MKQCILEKRNQMSLRSKYQPVINLLKELNLNQLKVKEDNGALVITGNVDSVKEKELIMKKIHQVNSENAMDIEFRVGIKS